MSASLDLEFSCNLCLEINKLLKVVLVWVFSITFLTKRKLLSSKHNILLFDTNRLLTPLLFNTIDLISAWKPRYNHWCTRLWPSEGCRSLKEGHERIRWAVWGFTFQLKVELHLCAALIFFYCYVCTEWDWVCTESLIIRSITGSSCGHKQYPECGWGFLCILTVFVSWKFCGGTQE